MEQVGRKGAVLFVNNSKATNADSSAQALACFNDMFWIAGGKPKTGGIKSLRKVLPAHPQGLSDRRGGGGIRRGRSTARWLCDRRHARPRGRPRPRDAEASGLSEPVVLLSPACASFDQYPNFEVRGDAFRELVLALPGVSRRAKVLNLCGNQSAQLTILATRRVRATRDEEQPWSRARNARPSAIGGGRSTG